jgi:putative sterol carrier protein
MAYKFPSDEWIQALKEKINTDEKYARIARKWEGDIMFQIEADGINPDPSYFYIDLWHGKCLDAFMAQEEHLTELDPAFVLTSPYSNFIRILKAELDPMQAMITRKLKVKGSMAYMMRNVPVVLDFVRCAQEIETEFIE